MSRNAAGKRVLQIALIIAGASGIALVFLPFAFDYVPVTDVFDDWGPTWVTVLPLMVLPFAIGPGHAMLLLTGRLPRWFCNLAYLLSATTIALFAHEFGWGFPTGQDALYLLLVLAVLGSLAWLCLRGIVEDSSLRSLIAMQGIYSVLMIPYLSLAWGDYRVGGWLGLVTTVAYTAQIVVAIGRSWWLLLYIIPLAGLTWLIDY